jgi:hypothetical protein
MDEQEALVNAILRSPRIRNRLVVLCEGHLVVLENGRAPSPQMYSRLAQMPDANFYKNCVPQDWQGQRLPQFFTCGGRSQVFFVYDQLLKRHEAAPEDSHLTPEKLYALVDLDIQCEAMPEGYPFQTTEEVHAALYQDGAITSEPGNHHRIWVTAFIHKEAFFVLPAMAAAWADGATPFFRGAPLDLRVLHKEVAQGLAIDADVARNLAVVAARLFRFKSGAALNCTSGESMRTAWCAAAAQAGGDRYDELLRALLSVAKVKPVWSQITPDPRWGATMPPENFRDQLALKVARTVSRTAPGEHSLSYFFAWLKPRR